MQYGFGYIVSSFIVLCVITYRFFFIKKIPTIRTRVFSILIILGLLDTIFDLLSCFCIYYVGFFPNIINYVFLYLFYSMQILIPFFMCFFVFALTGDLDRYKSNLLISFIPLSIGVVLLILNIPYHELFLFEADGTYVRTSLNYSIYGIAGLYVLASCISSCVLVDKIGEECRNVMFIDSIAIVVLVGIQYLYPDVSLTGVAIAFSITMMYLYLNNVDSFLDVVANCFDRQALTHYLEGGLFSKNIRYGVMISLTGFKHVNKIYGNSTGDEVLRQTANYLNQLVNPYKNCSVYRLVADIFLVLCDSKEDYEFVYQSLLNSCVFYSVDNKAIHVDMRFIRIEDFDIHANKDEFISILEFALDRAKNALLNHDVIINERFLNEYDYMKAIEKYVETAIHEKLFYMVYQPIYSIKEKKYTMLEALVRLKHPIYGEISPDVFVPLAEKNDMILEISNIVLEMASDFIIKYDIHQLGIRNLKVNLSALDFMDNSLQERIERILHKPDMKQGIMGFEITETMATNFNKELSDMFAWFNENHLSISIDDFGSGYANFENIMKMSFDMIKIDRSLLLQIHNSKKSSNIYSGLVKMVKELDVAIVAEGVETKEDVDILTNWGVSYIQGFYYSKPLVENELLAFLQNKNGAI